MSDSSEFAAIMGPVATGPRAIDETGHRYGRLVVMGQAPGRQDNKLMWRCQCDCGNEKITSGRLLRRGSVQSCGCLRAEMQATRALKHGMDRTPEHRTWVAMRQRCNNPNDTSFEYYGGRGISICERWMASFEAFFSDMGAKPFPGATIDREDPDGNYDPGNCRWASRKEQSNNQRRFKSVGGAQ